MRNDEAAERAASGEILPDATRAAGDLINLLEDGQLSAEIYEAMKRLGANIEEAADMNGGKAKGSITIKINMAKEEGMFLVDSDFKVVEPKIKRPRTVLWTNKAGDFVRFPPNQRQLFGVGGPRNVQSLD